MERSLDGKLALITGGGRGIGRAIAERLARDGARVVVTGRTRAELDEVAAAVGGGAVAIVCDLLDRAATDAMVAEVKAVGRVDVLVNNAGIAESAPLAETDDAMWDRIVETNATAPFRLTRAFVPAMVKAGWGRVITIASNAGLTGYGYTAAYCAAKHAAVGMTRALAIDLGRSGVTVNAVCPGWVATAMAQRAVQNIAAKTGRDEGSARAALESMSPQRRLVEPEEVAAGVAMLCGHEARGIHGQTLIIDGGQVMK
jgi:NAD(P)-dependent dehydrogenase (short-subunit alcohol dehydrogenase family)